MAKASHRNLCNRDRGRQSDTRVTLTVPPHTAKNPDGSDFTGELSISLVPEGFAPVALPETLAPGFLLTIQPVGVTFAQPVAITVPNVDQLSALSETDIWSLDSASGDFGVVGTGLVRGDGSAIDTLSGGIVTASWHALMPPRVEPDLRDQNDENHDPDLCDDCNSGSQTALSSGSLTVIHDLVPYRSNDLLRGLRLVYTSETADPRPVVSSRVTIEKRSSVAQALSTRLVIGGIDQGTSTFTDPAGLDENEDEIIRLAAQAPAADIGTGLFPYRLKLSSHFACSSKTAPAPPSTNTPMTASAAPSPPPKPSKTPSPTPPASKIPKPATSTTAPAATTPTSVASWPRTPSASPAATRICMPTSATIPPTSAILLG